MKRKFGRESLLLAGGMILASWCAGPVANAAEPSGAAGVDPPPDFDLDPPPPPVHSVLDDLGRTMVLEDGTIIRYLDDGRTVIQNPNGSREERFPGGGRVTTAPDGTTSYDRWKENTAAPIKKAEEKKPGYGQSMGPPWMPPYGFGIWERNQERKQESDSWPMKK